MGFEHLPGMEFVLEGQGLGSDEGSFGALQSLLEQRVYIPYDLVDRSTRQGGQGCPLATFSCGATFSCHGVLVKYRKWDEQTNTADGGDRSICS